MQIHNFNASKLRNTEFVSLGNDILEITKPYDWATSNVVGFYNKVETSVANFKIHLNKLSTVSETHGVELADVAFNNAWWAFKHVCKVYELSPEEQKQEAAKILIELSKSHGYNLHNESYQVQNSRVKMFLADCANKEEVEAAIETLGIQDQIGHVDDALTDLEFAINNRKQKAVSEKRADNIKLLRMKLATSLESMFKYLEAMSVIQDGGEIDDMIKAINESILKLDTSIKMRSAHHSEEV